jgi:small-conductance mechanosensitive channel
MFPCFRLLPRALLIALALLAAPGWAATDASEIPDASDADIETAAVRIDGRTLFRVRGLTAFPATERAEAITGRIVAAASDDALSPEAIVVIEGPAGIEIRAGDQRLMRVTPADAALEGVNAAVVAASMRDQIARVMARYRAERTPAALVRGALVSLAATAALGLALFGLGYAFRRLDTVLGRAYEQRRAQLEGKLGRDVMQSASLLGTLRSSLQTGKAVLGAILSLVWLDVVLAQFPWTRWLSDGLASLLLAPLATIGLAIVEYIPSLLFLVVLGLVIRFGLRMLRLYFSAIERGTITVARFDRDWSLPTYKILRTLVLILALVMAYPYLPGSGSAAFQGVSVFAGLLVSLGAASAVSNVISGYLVTYGRILRTGDWIRVGETIGVVTQVRLLTTRVRNFRNEEVTIPNSTIMTSSVTNYTALARERGLILQAEVGIGYETPWRQVEAMLLEAARRTPGLRTGPAPFVLQRSLGDFAVVYQLSVYKDGEPAGMLLVQSALFQNIQDVFNEYGVQIMTPAYVADTAEPKVVPKNQWHLPPAAPPPPASPPPAA